jgi:hypothetical protein
MWEEEGRGEIDRQTRMGFRMKGFGLGPWQK